MDLEKPESCGSEENVWIKTWSNNDFPVEFMKSAWHLFKGEVLCDVIDVKRLIDAVCFCIVWIICFFDHPKCKDFDLWILPTGLNDVDPLFEP